MHSKEEELKTGTKNQINESDIFLSPIYQLVPTDSSAPTPDLTASKPQSKSSTSSTADKGCPGSLYSWLIVG